jgi:hypothetical protein
MQEFQSNHPLPSPLSRRVSKLGLGTEFRSEKIPRNRLGTVSVIPRKKALIPRHSEFRGRANSEARNGTEWNSAEKITFTKQQQNNLTKWFVCTSKVVFSDTIIEIFGCRVLFWVGFSSTEWFGTAFREFISIFWNSGKEFRAVFSSAEWFGTEIENLHLFWFPGTEFRVVFSSEEEFGTELWEFASIFVPRNGIPSYFLFYRKVRNGIPRFSVPRTNRQPYSKLDWWRTGR